MIYAIGRNYASHAKELGNSIPKGNPIVFFKPHAALVESGHTITLPAFSKDVQFEAELVFKFGKQMEVAEIAIGNDLTARDKQREAQETKSPWGIAKGFKQSAGIGNWVSAAGVDLKNLELRLTHNGQVAQHGFTRDMLFDIPTIIKYLKENFPVEPGDLVYTGTPEGVKTIKPGDTIVAEIVGLSRGEWKFQ